MSRTDEPTGTFVVVVVIQNQHLPWILAKRNSVLLISVRVVDGGKDSAVQGAVCFLILHQIGIEKNIKIRSFYKFLKIASKIHIKANLLKK